jgi:diguanylate cyclase (GGDEF)-like protein/PAS domain S-box-containing protein
MMMPIERRIYAIGCPGELMSAMREIAEEVCGILDAEWIASVAPADEMRGYCIILFGSEHVSEVTGWTQDTAIIWIADQPDMSVLRQGFVDALTLPLDKARFAASLCNMICRCDLKRRLDIRENQLNTYYEISDDMLWTKDMADLHMDVNHILIKLAGKPREQIEGRHENEVYGLDPDAQGCKQSDFLVRTTGKMDYFEESMPGLDGRQHHLRVAKAPWLDGQGRIIGSIGLAKDVTELINEQTKFERFLNDLELGVVIVDNENTVLQTNRAYLELAGLSNQNIVGQKFSEPKLDKSLEFGTEDYIISRPNGTEIWTCNKFDITDYWGKQFGYTYVYHDVTLERKQEKKILNMAVTDYLTGIPNRAGMYQYLNAMDKNSFATFLYTDIDNFKMVNDCFGHIVGDRLLKSVAKLFRSALPDSFTARIGGDEFLSIISPRVKRQELETAVKALMEGIKRLPCYPQEILDTISLSIGVLYHHPLEDSLNSIMCKSDEGMYQAKRSGKNRCCFYEPAEFQSDYN